MKKYYIILSFILANGNGFSQQVFKAELEGGVRSSMYPGSLIENMDSSYIISGTLGNDTTLSLDCFVAKISKEGVVLWAKSYAMPSAEFNTRVIHGVDSGYLLAATTFSYPQNDEDSLKDIIALKLDTAGNEVWRKVLPARDFYSSCSCPDKSYILLGSEWAKNDTSSGFNMDYVLYKLKRNGKIIWKKTFGTPYGDDSDYSKLFCDKKSNIYFGGLTDSGATTYRSGLFYKLNSKGEFMYRTFFKEDVNANRNKNVAPSKIFEFQNQHYYVRDNGIYKIDLGTGIEKLIEQFSTIGKIDVRNNNITRAHQLARGVIGLSRLNSNFKPYKIVEHREGGRSGIAEVLATLDNGSAFLFQIEDTLGNRKAVLLKTDCNSNSDEWKACTLSEKENEINLKKIIAFPNPTYGSLTIEFNNPQNDVVTYKLYNSVGQVELAGEVKKSRFRLTIGELPNGIYFLRLSNGESVRLVKN